MSGEIHQLHRAATRLSPQIEATASEVTCTKWGWGRALATMTAVSVTFWLGLAMILVL